MPHQDASPAHCEDTSYRALNQLAGTGVFELCSFLGQRVWNSSIQKTAFISRPSLFFKALTHLKWTFTLLLFSLW